MANENEHEHVHFTASGDLENNGNGDSHPKLPPSPPPPAMNNLTPKFTSKALRGNLMREQVDRDPLFYYEVATVLGVGSMGSVAKVRKRDAAIGGSARKDLQDHFRREKQIKTCFNVPLVGGLFNFCLKGHLKPPSAMSGSGRMTGSGTSSLLEPRGVVEDYNDLHGEAPYLNENLYAMKSIHLSRVTDDSFVQELKNEIQILRRLDHPHIVRALETFEHRNQIFIVMVSGVIGTCITSLCMVHIVLVCMCECEEYSNSSLPHSLAALHSPFFRRNSARAATCTREIRTRRKSQRGSQVPFCLQSRTCIPRELFTVI
jgi:serine/threonine protein kinase